MAAFYGACPEEEAKRCFDLLLPHSQDAFETGCNFVAADVTIPKTFFICETDQAFPLPVQEQLVKGVPGMKEVRLASDHSPFLGRPQEMANMLVDIAYGRA